MDGHGNPTTFHDYTGPQDLPDMLVPWSAITAGSIDARLREAQKETSRALGRVEDDLGNLLQPGNRPDSHPDGVPADLATMLRTPGMRREEREIDRLAEERLAFFGERLMGYRWNQPAYSLSYANRRRLEIARATATQPRILLLDEPAAGMNPAETQEITTLISQLRREGGYTILVIEHDMHCVEGCSDRVVALDHGVKIAEGSFEHVATHPAVVEAYLGKGAAVGG